MLGVRGFCGRKRTDSPRRMSVPRTGKSKRGGILGPPRRTQNDDDAIGMVEDAAPDREEGKRQIPHGIRKVRGWFGMTLLGSVAFVGKFGIVGREARRFLVEGDRLQNEPTDEARG